MNNYIPNEYRKYNAGILLGIGLALIALGTLAIYGVVFATYISVIFLGWLFIFSGFIHLGHALYARQWRGFLVQLLVGLVSIAAGILLLLNPTIGAVTLTLLLGALFIAQGALRVWLSLTRKFEHWGWILASGLLSLLLGILILAQWPYSGLYVIGLFVGIDFIFSGWALVALSMKAKKVSDHHPHRSSSTEHQHEHQRDQHQNNHRHY